MKKNCLKFSFCFIMIGYSSAIFAQTKFQERCLEVLSRTYAALDTDEIITKGYEPSGPPYLFSAEAKVAGANKYSILNRADLSMVTPFQLNLMTDTIQKASKIYLESDPSALFFRGFSIIVRRSSTFTKNFTLGIGYYKATLPDFYINENPTHQGKGWNAKVNNGFDLFLDFYIFNPNKGLSTGMVLSMYEFEIQRNGSRSNFNSFVGTWRVGYMWRPFNKYFYLMPWVGLANNKKVSGNNQIDGEKFEIPEWSIVPTIHIGVSF